MEEGDFIMSGAGTIGRISRVPAGIKQGVFNQALIRFKINNEVTDSEYFIQFVRADNMQRKLTGANPGSAINNLVPMSEVKNWDILVPSKQEQKRLGDFFKILDNIITLHQRKLDLLKQMKKGFLQRVFPKNDEKVPELRFADFIGEWEQRKLGDVVDVKSGRDYKHLNSGDIPVYGTGGYMLNVDEALSYDEDAVGIGRKGTIDKPYILKAPFWTVDTLFYTLPHQEIDLNFIYAIFQNIDWKSKDESTGVPSLSKTTINKVTAFLPRKSEQQKIGSLFQQIDQVITFHQEKLNKLKLLKKSYLQNMFI